jgi:hypothetical protein
MTNAEALAQELASFGTYALDREAGVRIEFTNVALMINSLQTQAGRLVSITLDAAHDPELEHAAQVCQARCSLLQKDYNKLEEPARLGGFPDNPEILGQLTAIRAEARKLADVIHLIAAQYDVVPPTQIRQPGRLIF